jgi:hypothetical protein
VVLYLVKHRRNFTIYIRKEAIMSDCSYRLFIVRNFEVIVGAIVCNF